MIQKILHYFYRFFDKIKYKFKCLLLAKNEKTVKNNNTN